jgi:hypothetical protein
LKRALNEVTDILDNWSNRIKEIALTGGVINAFDSINRITRTLRATFPGAYFLDSEENKHRDGFLNQLLISYSFSSLYKLLEYAQTIEFFSKQDNTFKLFEPERKINDNGLRDTFFELWLSKFLSENGFETNTHDFYIQTKDSVKKPLDCTLIFEGEKYLIECKKIYNLKQEIINDIILEVTAITKGFSDGFNVSELFGGYVVFSNKRITPADKDLVLKNFRKLIKRHFHGLRHRNSLDVSLSHEFRTESVSVKIISSFLLKNIKDNIFEKESDILLFDTVLHGTFEGRVTLNHRVKIGHPDIVASIADKINSKVKQHKNSTIKKKIIALEFENVELSPNFKNSYPVDINTFTESAFTKLIRNDLSILIILKTIRNTGCKIEFGIISDNTFNSRLKQRLTSMTMTWR